MFPAQSSPANCLEVERQQMRLPGKWYTACRQLWTTWFLPHKQIDRITILPGIRPKELGSTPGSMKQRQGNYRIDRRRKNIFTLPFKTHEKEQCSWQQLIPTLLPVA